MLQQLKLTGFVNNPHKIFGFQLKESLHLHQIAFQFISLCFSCLLWMLLLQRLSQFKEAD
jgi:hypothetical protein